MSQVKQVEKIAKNVPSKADKFVELAQKRVTRAMLAIRSVGSLAGPRYKYTPEQAAKIANVLQRELDAVYQEFTTIEEDKKVRFTL